MLRIAIAFFMLFAVATAEATEAAWALLRNGGQVVLVNHAHAPGSGDPANFELENCSTQRNLSDQGRQQARRMGALFYARAAPIERVLSSRYCRARETADIAFRDSPIETFDALDALAPDPEAADAQIEAMMEHILNYGGSGNLIMVTHEANIEAIANIRPREGEAVVLSRSGDAVRVAGRVTFN
ncbi:histidine phosphatase family protein [Chelativorans salis]|uniref:Histidine phosphatase family protein n=1 Tax=Chelativorans salis TaxID=2978478 RepID=A0ABT2LL15_9HYPH|nr:histidine phosphatase family protein [Chelativorans sp. EGI FJ00035]MCT7375280.1 histidine phosphatase family protein [Chelativorans sp. EGI FJ00035]